MKRTKQLSRFNSKSTISGSKPFLPSYKHPALESGRTIFPSKVLQPTVGRRAIKYGFNNSKLGSEVTKGRLKGAKIYYLTLEERATCPRTCRHWRSCYGNNMHLADRFMAGPVLERAIEQELTELFALHKVILIRLHVLGDFYSASYVRLWAKMLRKHPNLHVFGFTARKDPNDTICREIVDTMVEFKFRFAIRFSHSDMDTWATTTIDMPENAPKSYIVCPEQLGKTSHCGTCGLCWTTDKNIAFMQH